MSKAMFGFFVDQDKYYCCYCNQVKFIIDFSKDNSKSTGFRSKCKECHNEYIRDWVRNDLIYPKSYDDIKDNNTYWKVYREKNRDKMIEYFKKIKITNSDKQKKYDKDYRERNRENLKLKRENRSLEKKEEIKIYAKNYMNKYYKDNREKILKKSAEKYRLEKENKGRQTR